MAATGSCSTSAITT
ncbi:MAG: hypothetical protein EA426_04765 [Spirochaetaceae bacterium]|nr:MAG: hypothetical protein EA426_04765 [Spirochaetaceae bacterium]